MKGVWTRLAEQRAIDAFAWIAAERPHAAITWLDRVLDRVGELKTFPDLGRPVPELARPDYRQLLVPPYRVVLLLPNARFRMRPARSAGWPQSLLSVRSKMPTR